MVGQIVPWNPTAAVRGPTHVVRRGKTPVLQPGKCGCSSTRSTRRPSVASATGPLLGVMILQLRPDVGLRRHAYLRDGGTLECAQAIAGHECACTTQLYDSTADDITAEDIERIRFLRIAGILTNLALGKGTGGKRCEGFRSSGAQYCQPFRALPAVFLTRWDLFGSRFGQ